MTPEKALSGDDDDCPVAAEMESPGPQSLLACISQPLAGALCEWEGEARSSGEGHVTSPALLGGEGTLH